VGGHRRCQGSEERKIAGVGSVDDIKQAAFDALQVIFIMNAATRPTNAFYAQSGGVTAVINTTACAVIQAARQHPETSARSSPAATAFSVRCTEDLIDTSLESDADIARLRHTPGGAFGSCRYKLKGLDEHRAQYERLIDGIPRARHRLFLLQRRQRFDGYRMEGVADVRKTGYPLTCVGIPKTVDNDLPHTDNCPGFGSVAKYVATSMREAGSRRGFDGAHLDQDFRHGSDGPPRRLDHRCLRVGREAAGQPPHLLLFPEMPFDEAAFLVRVEDCVASTSYCTIAVSEGLRMPMAGKLLRTSGTTDAFGHAQLGGVGQVIAQLIKDRLGLKYHWALPDYLQRSARHLASKTDVDQAYALGKAAVELAVAGRSAVMPGIVRLADAPYRWEIGVADLANVANVERKMPREFISADGFQITDKCRAYLAPLIAGEDPPPYRDGLPDYVRLKNRGVPRQLEAFCL
jgi:6-phosphofructokinase